jgi:predicted DNA-binding transcriptional regulator YafY
VDHLECQNFTVTKRTIERDLQSLSATFPITVDTRSSPYGWSWEKGAAAIDVPGLSSAEAMTFAMTRQFLETLMPPSMLEQLAPYFGMAEQRLEALGDDAPTSAWGKKIAVIPPTQALLPPKIVDGVQAAIQEAVYLDRQVKIQYRKRGEKSNVEYVVHPLGLIQRGGVLYLVCTFFDYPGEKLLVVHRMRSVAILEEKTKRPKGFKVSDFINRGGMGFGTAELIELVARFTHEAGEHLHDTPLSISQTLTDLPDGRIELRAQVHNTLQLRWWLQGFADGVEVMAPADLRAIVSENMQRAAARYH